MGLQKCTSSPLSLLGMVTKIPKLYLVSQHLLSERTLGSLFFNFIFHTKRWWWWRGGKAFCSTLSLLHGLWISLKYLFQGANIGIDDEDDSTFTINCDQKTFHFQGMFIDSGKVMYDMNCGMIIIVKLGKPEHQKYFLNVIVVQEKSQSGLRKLNCKQEC